MTRQRLPHGRQWVRLAVVGGGVVVGFPLLTSFALTAAPASHGAVVIALLPAATATMAVLRGHERPPVMFWVVSGVGAVAAMGFASAQWGGLGHLHWSDLLLFGAVLAAAVGYAEGGLLARELGAWQTVSWALVLCSPLMLFLTVWSATRQTPSGTPVQWAAFAYLGVVSMFLGFFAWYRGLAIGPMAQVSQVQLVQPVLTICWAGAAAGRAAHLDHHRRRPRRHPVRRHRRSGTAHHHDGATARLSSARGSTAPNGSGCTGGASLLSGSRARPTRPGRTPVERQLRPLAPPLLPRSARP